MAGLDEAHVAHVLGFPRIGAQRELKFAMEAFCNGDAREATLRATGATIRARHWQAQADAGLDFVTVGDFAWYDHVLSALALLGALPRRFGIDAATLELRSYYAMARGDQGHAGMELRQWFDTNYHYLVPEWSAGMSFDGGVDWLFDELNEAREQGYRAKLVLLGPLSLLYLGKLEVGLNDALELLPQLVAAYARLLARLREQGVELVQIEEPILTLTLPAQWRDAFAPVYAELAERGPNLLLTTYFGAVDAHFALLRDLPVAGVHIDGVCGAAQLDTFAQHWPQDKVLSVGIVDGRNVWRCDLDAALVTLQALQAKLGTRLWLASSCSLAHVPVDLSNEHKLDDEMKSWLAFAVQKLDEIGLLKKALQGGVVAEQFTAAHAALVLRRQSSRIRNALVQKNLQSLCDDHSRRGAAFSVRRAAQQERWQLPQLPTTCDAPAASAQMRQLRAAYQRGEIGHLDYLQGMRDEIRLMLDAQEALGQDVLVYGAATGEDSMDFFCEQLWGFGFTVNGWVQRDGASCIKPPFIYGDVYRPEAMTVGWIQFAQSLTQKPLKSLLTGPLTLLQLAFVRDDQPRALIALQLALALRDEITDLEQAGIGMIQIDEPALAQGLPLQQHEQENYLDWTRRAFQLSTAGVGDATQIHAHLGVVRDHVWQAWMVGLDVDVITCA